MDEKKLSEMLIAVFGNIVGTEQEKMLHQGDFVIRSIGATCGEEVLFQLTKLHTKTWVSAWDLFDAHCGRSCHCL